MSILNQCVDDSERSYDVSLLCDQFRVSDDANECISLAQFTSKQSPTACPVLFGKFC